MRISRVAKGTRRGGRRRKSSRKRWGKRRWSRGVFLIQGRRSMGSISLWSSWIIGKMRLETIIDLMLITLTLRAMTRPSLIRDLMSHQMEPVKFTSPGKWQDARSTSRIKKIWSRLKASQKVRTTLSILRIHTLKIKKTNHTRKWKRTRSLTLRSWCNHQVAANGLSKIRLSILSISKSTAETGRRSRRKYPQRPCPNARTFSWTISRRWSFINTWTRMILISTSEATGRPSRTLQLHDRTRKINQNLKISSLKRDLTLKKPTILSPTRSPQNKRINLFLQSESESKPQTNYPKSKSTTSS